MDEIKRIKLCGIPLHQKLRNSADFDKSRNTEFRVIPRNSGQLYYTEYTEFKKTYGIPYKRNSENTLVFLQSLMFLPFYVLASVVVFFQ